MDKRITILLLEDSPADAEFLETLASVWQPSPSVVTVGSLKAGLSRLAEGGIDLVIVDLGLPDSVGMDTLSAVLQAAGPVPVLVLTTLDDDDAAFEAIVCGAQDYLVKGQIAPAQILRSIKSGLERARALDSLTESKNRLEAIVDGALDAVITIDSQGNVLQWNGQAKRIFGFSAQEALGQELAALIIPVSQRDAHRNGLKKFQSGGGGTMAYRRQEVMAIHADGHELPVELSICPSRQGKTWIFNAFLRDMSQQHRQQKCRAAEFAVTHALAEASSLPEAAQLILPSLCQIADCRLAEIFLVDHDSGAIAYLDGWCRDLEALADFHAAARDLNVVAPDSFPGLVALAGEPVMIGDISKQPCCQRSKLAEAAGLQSVAGYPVKLGDRTLALLLFFFPKETPPDVELLEVFAALASQIAQFIERKQSEERELQLLFEAQEARSHLILMRQREDFMSTLAHDLKTPILGADRLLEVIIDGAVGSLSKEQSELLSKLRESNNSLLKMIYNLLDVYRFESSAQELQMVELNLVCLVSECLSEIQALADGKKIRLASSFSPEIKAVRGDAWYLRRLVTNLLSNAIKFTPEGGLVQVAAFCHNGSVQLDVKDTGIGIPQSELTSIFQRFRQMDQRNRAIGSGLGLHLCRQIVEAHNGTIGVQSDPETGSTFTVILPVWQI